ncbi:MAG: sugar ABC transporter permease [Actinomyces succiniciruminis]|uniref:Binding-protein-dependent transport systems inner membrane component n=1 Tax=Actinomyces succiniciruminis TaxID=1522002 RepID=A0A1L7RI82_9ACTO|nr:sugar ABC transporter permease [Actinomyces succiniciruminis]MBM6979470.1 sugar ABC transporter permease [Actinomyces succiniciruminis]CED90469.1 Binding-protein-dependent transport systems inner membrane component [Actinomyces succiniciruminis]
MTTPATFGSTAASRGATSARRRHSGRTLRRTAPLIPAVVLLALFLLGPIIYSLYGSLTDRAMSGYKAAAPSFVGLGNYVTLFSDPAFLKSILLTAVFVFASAIVGQNVLGMVLAVLMRHCARPLASLVGGIVVVAWALPEIVAAFACYAFFASEGTLNSMLSFIGLEGPKWLLVFPMFSVILANIWRGTAFSMMQYNAALAEVPPEVKESAAIDGASTAQTFFRITLPIIRRSIATNLMLTTLQTLGVFTLIWVMTGGGPGTSSSTLPVLAYQEAFKFSQVGYGTAIATVTLLVGALFSVVYMKLLKPEVD